MRLFPSLVAVSALVLSLVVRPALPVAAASITVTTTNDELNTDSACSLREAIQAVNTASGVSGCAAGSGNDTILLPAGTYTLTIAGGNENNNATGDLDIFPTSSAVPRTLTIQGSGATTTVVDGNQLDRVFHLIDSECDPDPAQPHRAQRPAAERAGWRWGAELGSPRAVQRDHRGRRDYR